MNYSSFSDFFHIQSIGMALVRNRKIVFHGVTVFFEFYGGHNLLKGVLTNWKRGIFLAPRPTVAFGCLHHRAALSLQKKLALKCSTGGKLSISVKCKVVEIHEKSLCTKNIRLDVSSNLKGPDLWLVHWCTAQIHIMGLHNRVSQKKLF